MIEKIGILTSGGDSPGMNACIRAITKYALNLKLKIAFIKNGFKGLVENDIQDNIKHSDVDNIINQGGTIIGSARYPEFAKPMFIDQGAENLKNHNIDAIIVIGGNGSFYGAQKLADKGVPCIGIPGTIDNDIKGTDRTIGFDTCLNTIVRCVSNIHDSARSHNRCMIVEIMGRDCGDLTVRAGIACGASAVLIPEKKWKLDSVIQLVERTKKFDQPSPLVLVTEMQTDVFHLAEAIQQFTSVPTRATQLGFVQRGGSPSFFDRYLAALMGTESVKLLNRGVSSVYLAYVKGKIVTINIQDEIIKNPKKILKIEVLNNKIIEK